MYRIFLLVILFIITLLFLYKSIWTSNEPKLDHILDKINNDKSDDLDLFNNHGSYRLGDAFYKPRDPVRWVNNLKSIWHKNNIPLKELLETYPNSILAEYIKLSNYAPKDWDTLIKIINNKFYRDININKSTDCLMHVRIGDVIEDLCPGKHFLRKFYFGKMINIFKTDDAGSVRCRYIRPLKYYQKKIKKLTKMGITTVYIIAGSHIKLPNYKYSTYYINKIMEEITKAGIQVKLKLGGSPDDDLLFSINFDYFIMSVGEYCRLIKELNNKINSNFTII
tara:strand:- start:4204 stop:5043 length:840 start_codon:yes stop_codon:yes gene_type:complete